MIVTGPLEARDCKETTEVELTIGTTAQDTNPEMPTLECTNSDYCVLSRHDIALLFKLPCHW